MVFLEDKLEQEEEDLVELYEEDIHYEVVWLVSTSAQKIPLLDFQPGDGRFSGIELELYKVLHTEEIDGECVHLCEPKPWDKLSELLEPAEEALELRECCDEQALDENLTLSF